MKGSSAGCEGYACDCRESSSNSGDWFEEMALGRGCCSESEGLESLENC